MTLDQYQFSLITKIYQFYHLPFLYNNPITIMIGKYKTSIKRFNFVKGSSRNSYENDKFSSNDNAD